MNLLNRILVLSLLSASWLPLSAQLPEEGGSILQSDLPGVTVGARVEDIRRRVKDGNTDITLKMPRAVVAAQFPLAPGISPWVEAGWHEPDLANGTDARGGFTWGLGASFRPWLFTIREDPEAGPRDWLAMKVDASYRAGSAEPSESSGDVEWTLVEGKLGVEYRERIFGSRSGPMQATGFTAGAGVVFNSLEAEKPGFNGSESNSIGMYLLATYDFGPNTFFGLEADWYGGSDRRIALITGRKF